MNTVETELLLNFLYPSKSGKFEDMFENKSKTFELLFKLFENFLADRKFVITLDNFDYVDGFSYEFLSKLIRRDLIFSNLKLLLVYNEPRSAQSYFYYAEKLYLDVCVAPLEV